MHKRHNLEKEYKKMAARCVYLPDEVIVAVNKKAAEDNRSFSFVLAEVLRKEFSLSKSGQKSA